MRPTEFIFEPGQYTQIGLVSPSLPDSKGHSRQFSIASSPDNRTDISVVFRDTGSGFKRSLLALPSGSPLLLEQAAGSFLLPTDALRPLVFVAGGVGISPFMSYFRYMRDAPGVPIYLLYGTQSREHTAFLDELGHYTRLHPQFYCDQLYQPPTPELFAHYAQRIPKALWFVVGPPGMVATAVYGLEAQGVPPDSIIRESFEGY